MADPQKRRSGGGGTDKEFQVITSALDDCRRLIAAGKVLRWDVVKWAVTVNTALATSVVLAHSRVPFLFALAVALAGQLLIWHYNKRMTGARNTTTTLTNRLKEFDIDYNEITGAKAPETNRFWNYLFGFKPLSRFKPAGVYSAGEGYDWQEMLIFSATLWVSAILSLLASALSASSR